MKAVLIFFVLIISVSCKSQDTVCKINYCLNKPVYNNWIPFDKMNFEDDSIQSYYLIFERDFNDTLLVIVDGNIVNEIIVKTNKTLSVVEKVVIIGNNDINKCISLRLKNRNDCIDISIYKKYKYYYITRTVSGLWNVNYSNYIRAYH